VGTPTKWLWDQLICSGGQGRGAAKEEFEPWRARTVTHADGSGELDARKCDPAVKDCSTVE